MAIKKPLVLDSAGGLEELQAGDNLDVSANKVTRTFTSVTIAGEPVYADTNTSVDGAQANADGTSNVVGLAAAAVGAAATGDMCISGVVTLTTGEWDALTGETGGLTRDLKYFLDDATAGRMLQEDNLTSLGAGDYLVELGTAISTTEMQLDIKTKIKKA